MPIDISVVADGLALDKVEVHQDEVLNNLFRGHQGATRQNTPFESLPLNTVYLSEFQKNFVHGRASSAISMLNNRTRIRIDRDFLAKPEDDDIVWDSDKSTIDFMLCVGADMGLKAAIPLDANRLWTVKILLKMPYREFKDKHGHLGFDPTGRMLYFGQRDGEDIWLGMLPRPFLDGHVEDVPTGTCTGSPRMKARHYRQIVMILAKVLHGLRNRAFICHDIYSLDLEGPSPHFDLYTDIL